MTGEMCDSQQGAWLRTQPTEPQVPTSPTKRGTSKAGSEHRAETAARSRLPQGCTSARVRFILRSGAQQVQVHGFYDHIHHSQVDVNRRAASAPEQKAQGVARFASPPSLACVTSRFAGHNMKKSRRLGFSVTSMAMRHPVNVKKRSKRVPILRLLACLGVTRKCSPAAGVSSYALFTPTNSTVHTTHPAITYTFGPALRTQDFRLCPHS